MPIDSEDEKEDAPQRLIEYFNLFWRRKVWFFIPFVLAITITILLIRYLPRTYRSTTLILVEGQKVPTAFVQSTVSENVEGRLSTIQQQILSRSFLQKIIDQFGLYKDSQESRETILKMMEESVQIKTVVGKGKHNANVDSFSIGYIGRDPQVTMHVTNRLAALFIEENLKIREQSVVGTTQFIDSQLEELKKKLEQQEGEVSRFKQLYGGELPGQLDANMRTVDRLQIELRNLKTTLQPILQAQQDRKRRLIILEKTHQENHPDVQALVREIHEFESGETSIGVELIILQGREKQLLSQMQIYEKAIASTPQREQELTILLRDYENIQRNYQVLLDKKLNAQISENLEKKQQGEQFRILDPANLPQKPYKPNPVTIGLGGILLGLFGGIALVLGREALDTSIRRPEELERLVPFPILSTILDHNTAPSPPSEKKGKSRGKPKRQNLDSWTYSSSNSPHKDARKTPRFPSQNGDAGLSTSPAADSPFSIGSPPAFSEKKVASGLIAFTEPHSVLTEQYRLLFMKLHHLAQQKKTKIISFTSSVKGEGKTTTISNLAIVAARDFGRKSLLIDADFKNPTVGQYFQVEQPFGVMDVIKKRCALEQALTPGPVDNLTLLPMGQSWRNYPGEILSIGDLDDVLAKVRGQYNPLVWDETGGAFPQMTAETEPFDYIWIDVPPLIPVFDMTLISESIDGIVFVVRSGEAPKHIVHRAVKLLDGSKVIGSVLNGAKVPWMAKAYEYGYYSYVSSQK